jgi:integral membrane protein (TIGR01906 family)
MKYLTLFSRWIFVLCLPIFCLSASIAWAVNSAWLYNSLFEKYDVAQTLTDNGLPVTDEDLNDITHGFIRYFNNSDKYIDLTVEVNGNPVPLFTEEETIHFKDVKDLFRFDYLMLLMSFIYSLIFIGFYLFRERGKYHRNLARDGLSGGILTLAVMAALGLAVVINFDGFWLFFHQFAFANIFWSAEGNMLLLFPGDFWFDMVSYCALFAAGLAILIAAGSGTWLFLNRSSRTNSAAKY